MKVFFGSSLVVIMMTVGLVAATAPTPIVMKYFSAEKNQYTTINIVNYQGFKISENCLQNQPPKCEAWIALQEKVAPQTSANPYIGNPAARYCFEHNSNNQVLFDKQKKEYDYCMFRDGSAISAWDLYNKHFDSKTK